MSMAPVSAKSQQPIILVKGDSASINRNSNIKYTVIGGDKVVSQGLQDKFDADRIAGKDRYETNRNVLEKFYPNSKNRYFTNGETLIDALSAASIAKNDGITFVNKNKNLDLLENINTIQIGGISNNGNIIDIGFDTSSSVKPGYRPTPNKPEEQLPPPTLNTVYAVPTNYFNKDGQRLIEINLSASGGSSEVSNLYYWRLKPKDGNKNKPAFNPTEQNRELDKAEKEGMHAFNPGAFLINHTYNNELVNDTFPEGDYVNSERGIFFDPGNYDIQITFYNEAAKEGEKWSDWMDCSFPVMDEDGMALMNDIKLNKSNSGTEFDTAVKDITEAYVSTKVNDLSQYEKYPHMYLGRGKGEGDKALSQENIKKGSDSKIEDIKESESKIIAYVKDNKLYFATTADSIIPNNVLDDDKRHNAKTKEMFANLTNLKSVDLSGFDLSYIHDSSQMFYGCSALTDVKGLKMSNVTDTNTMFDGCSSLKTLDLSQLYFSNVKTMHHMFSDCTNLETIKFDDRIDNNKASLELAPVFNTELLFNNCTSLSNETLQDFIEKVNLVKLTQCHSMFINTKLSDENLNTLLNRLREAKTVDNEAKLSDLNNMFNGCKNLTGNFSFDGIDLSENVSFSRLFEGCENIKSIDFGNSVSKPEMDYLFLNYMFNGCKNLESVDLSQLDLLVHEDPESQKKLSISFNMENMFNGCEKLNSLKLNKSFTEKQYLYYQKTISGGTVQEGPADINKNNMFNFYTTDSETEEQKAREQWFIDYYVDGKDVNIPNFTDDPSSKTPVKP